MFVCRAIGTWCIVGKALIVLAGLLLSPAPCAAGEPADQPAMPQEAVEASEPVLPAPSIAAQFPRTWQATPWMTARLRGRVDTDAIWTSQSPANETTFGDLGSAVGLRRARLGLEGSLGDNGRYIAEIDLASGQVIPQDAFVGLGNVQAGGEKRIGHFREPFSLEGGTSANSFAFMERSPVNMLDPARNWGLGYFGANDDGSRTFAMGVFQAGTGPGDFQSEPGSTVGFTERITLAPINSDQGRRLLHLGAALSERIPEQGVIILNQQPQSALIDFGNSSASPFVPQIAIPARYQQLINLQCALARGSFWSQAEWYSTVISQTNGPAVFYHGCHVDCGYFLTGENRAYSGENGVFGAVRVNRPVFRCGAAHGQPHGWGAWELTARFAYLDFFDRNTPLGPSGQLVGVQLSAATFGVNWYLADRVRLMFNYSYEMPNEPNTGSSVANIFATRLGIFW
jgi:phosphate-selective porin OprO/OprP